MRIGDKYSFVPSGFVTKQEKTAKPLLIPYKLTGTVVGINLPHRFCRVRYTVYSKTLYECFKIIQK